MDVDSFACFDAIFLEKKGAMRLSSQKKVSITSLKFKNCIQELDFLEIRYYANSVVITLSSIFQNQTASKCTVHLCFGQVKISLGKKTLDITCPTGQLLKKLISTPINP